MCLVIDACTMSRVFNPANKEHYKFVHVLNWIMSTGGKGRMVYGGTKYYDELVKSGGLSTLVELRKTGKAVWVKDEIVDKKAAELKELFPEDDFDDEHLVALVVVSRCCVVCTVDKTAMAYLKRKDVFGNEHGVKRPKIYCGHKGNEELCCNENVADICKDR